jgi:hypothetical protein
MFIGVVRDKLALAKSHSPSSNNTQKSVLETIKFISTVASIPTDSEPSARASVDHVSRILDMGGASLSVFTVV